MLKSTGYFIAEILISLFLCASISLLLLKQQWHLSQLVGHIQTRLHKLNDLENKYERNLRGFSLSEMLICILLASLLLAGLTQQYSQVYRQNSILTTNLEQNLDLQLVSELLRNSLHGAGFTPCGNLDNLHKMLDIDLSAVVIVDNSIATSRMNSDYYEFSNVADVTRFLDKSIKHRQYLITDCYNAALINNDSKNENWHYIENNYVSPIYIGEYIQEVFWIKDLKNLYYKFKHSEKLTEYVKSLHADWLDENYLQIKLTLANNNVQNLLVRIRER